MKFGILKSLLYLYDQGSFCNRSNYQSVFLLFSFQRNGTTKLNLFISVEHKSRFHGLIVLSFKIFLTTFAVRGLLEIVDVFK